MYLSAAIALVIAIIALLARRRQRRPLSYTTRAPPRAQEAAAELFVALARIVELGREYDSRAAVAPGESHIVRTLERAKTELGRARPTYANYLAVYRGLSSTDESLLAAADAYESAAAHMVATAARTNDDVCRRPIGDTLEAMGRQLRLVVRTVHRLGAALEVE
jgi:hypothetical protein